MVEKVDPSNENKDEIMRLAVVEQQRSHDHLSNIYDQLRIKALALIAGEVAIITFVFSGKSENFFPIGTDRLIFFYAGIALLGLSFAFLLWIISSVPWKIPHGFDKSRKTKGLKSTYENTGEFLGYLNDDYVKVNQYCAQIVTKKCKVFNWVVYCLPAGVIILLVITKFGGRI